MSKNRILASLISNDTSKVKSVYTDSDNIVTSASLGVTAAAGTAIYSSADTLPVSATNGDQALVTSTNRLYIYSNGGWYNIALINTTPYWSVEASTTYDLSTTGGSTVITILAVDSEGVPITYTATTDSDFDGIATITKDSDNGRVFTVIPTDSENGTAVAGSGTVTFKANDGVNLVSTLSTFSISFTVTNSGGTVMLLKADSDGGTLTDHSSNAYTVTGSAISSSFSPYHPGGYSVYFDGASDYLTTPIDTSLQLGTGDFTIEGWIYLISRDNTRNGIFGNYNSYSAGSLGMFAGHSSGTTTAYQVSYNGASFPASVIQGGTIVYKEWVHFAVVRNSGTMDLYIDGTSVDSITATASLNGVGSNFVIGAPGDGTTNGMNGYLRDFRVVKGTAVYTSDFTPPTQSLTAVSGTSLLACHLPYIADGSNNNHTITVNGNTSTKRYGPYDYIAYNRTDHGGSIYTNGSGNIATIATQLTALGTSEFTIEGWWYPSGSSLGSGFYAEGAIGGPNGPFLRPTDGYFGNNSSYNQIYGSDPGFQLGAWNHWMLTHDSSNVLRFYLNGNYVSGVTRTVSGTATSLDVGAGYQGGAYYSQGYHSDVRRVIGTARETGTGTYTIPTEPLTAITGTSALLGKNDTDIWDASGQPNIGTKYGTSGNMRASAITRKFTSSDSLRFNTDGYYLVSGYFNRFTAVTDPCTIEGWARTFNTNITTFDTIFAANRSSDGNNQLILGMENGQWTVHYSGNAMTSQGSYSDNTWYHFAIVLNDGSANKINIYIDGTSIFTRTSALDTALDNCDIAFGCEFDSANAGTPGNYFGGYMQDLRVSDFARYTSNFTAPTSTFTG